MPFRRRRRRRTSRRRSRRRPFRTRRRSFRRRRFRGRRRRSLAIGRSIIPRSIVVTFPWVWSSELSVLPGVDEIFAVRANGPANPHVDLVTNQPLGWDQWGALYSTYTCIRSHISVQVRTGDNDSNYPLMFLALFNNQQLSDIISAGTSGRREQPMIQWRELQPLQQRQPTILRRSFNSNRFFMRKALTDDQQEHSFTVVPTAPFAQAIYWLVVRNASSVFPMDCHVTVSCRFTCFLRRPKILAPS